MKDSFKFDKSYPDGYEYIGTWARTTRDIIKHMDEEATRYAESHLPEPGIPFDRVTQTRLNFTFDSLQEAKYAFYRSTASAIEREIKRVCPDRQMARWIRHSASFDIGSLYMEMPAHKPEEKTQTTIDDKPHEDLSNSASGIPEHHPSDRVRDHYHMSKRFTQSLHYFPATENSNKTHLKENQPKASGSYEYLTDTAHTARHILQKTDQEIARFSIGEPPLRNTRQSAVVGRVFTSLEKAKSTFRSSVLSSLEKQIKATCPDREKAHDLRNIIYSAISVSYEPQPKEISGHYPSKTENVYSKDNATEGKRSASTRFTQKLNYDSMRNHQVTPSKDSLDSRKDRDRE
ncbi:hypothetical protein [Runella aurantiaca]|uniref:Uncharacterized protein n=1 Tax=Runella aurantiaca TaxID=2282308 RepID=A0A369IKQ5_9BACT|nr:hypothetical protein [Runella aurantiaca]RDB07824.1 hypothetical protein DVG78_01860 [Runella aurantiaca]